MNLVDLPSMITQLIILYSTKALRGEFSRPTINDNSIDHTIFNKGFEGEQ